MDVLVGVDWGCGAHAVCVIDAKGRCWTGSRSATTVKGWPAWSRA